MYTEDEDLVKQPKKITKKIIIIISIIMLFLVITGIILFLYFKKQADIKAKTPYISIPTAYIINEKWTNQELQVIIDEDKSLISEYSFDGGNTWQKENTKMFTENTTIEVMVKDTKGLLSEKTTVAISKIDKISPVITLETPTTIDQNSTFSLRTNVTVSDKESGVSILYTTDPISIDTTVPGTYTVNYIAKDVAGNETTVIRTIIVKEAVLEE